MQKVHGSLTDNKILRQLFIRAEISFIFADLSKAIGPIIDLIFVSISLGTVGVTVMGYVAPLIMFCELIGSSISFGARNRVAVQLGAGKIDDANSTFSNSVFLGVAMSMSLVIILGVFCSGVTMILGARDPEYFAMTKMYIYGYIIGLPFFALTRILTPYLQMEGQYQRINTVALLTTVIDIAADAFVVFILHGGMFEIALATSAGYIIPFFIDAAFFIRKKYKSVFSFSFKRLNPEICGEILRLGAPSVVSKGSNALGGTLINNLLTALNVNYLVAAYGVFSQITVFIRSSWYGPIDALTTLASTFIGEEDKQSLRETQRFTLINSIILTSSVTVLLFTFADTIAGLFLKSQDPEALRMGAECIRVACFSIPFHTVVYSFSAYIISIKRISFSCFYNFLMECGNIVPIMFLLLQVIGYQGAWLSRVISMFTLSAIAVLYIYFQKEGKTFRDKMLLMPESFGSTPDDEITAAATSADEIVDLSRLAVAFALEHGADMKRAKTFGLVTEELAILFTEHGFNDGKPHNINARLVAKGDDLIIRMRDDCKPFNLTEYYRIVRDDLEKGVGLSIIMKQSKDVQYTNTLGTNNLIVRI